MIGPDIQATFAATLVDEWVRCGVTDAVVAPGSRSTPIALALAADGRLRLHVVLDERSAGFTALGMGLASGRPAVVLTTSGTAAVELHPAVVEAHEAGVPLVAVTADRPPELHGVGAPQTVDQEGLFTRALRWQATPGVPDQAAAGAWRSLAARAWSEATSGPAGPGPVHLNLAFREPLIGVATDPPPGRAGGAPWHVASAGVAPPSAGDVACLVEAGPRGLIVAGAGAGDADAVTAMASALGWPVLADPLSGCRVPGPLTVAAADALLRAPLVDGWRPEVVLRLGRPWASRVMATWLSRLDPDVTQIVVDPYGRWSDPERMARLVLRCDPTVLALAVAAAEPGGGHLGWAEGWASAEAVAQEAFDRVLTSYREITEPGVARSLGDELAAGTTLVTSSSMPVRDVEWYLRPRTGLRVLANRGANGIDGVISTSLGVAATGPGPTVTLLGDLAFLYDAGALLGASRQATSCTLVVIDNDGGGIFSFLPQASALPAERFERLWGTPHGADLAAIASAYGVPVTRVRRADEVGAEVRAAIAAGGVRVVLARTDRRANVEVHDALNAAVTAAVRVALSA